jgi:hypothetical protein
MTEEVPFDAQRTSAQFMALSCSTLPKTAIGSRILVFRALCHLKHSLDGLIIGMTILSLSILFELDLLFLLILVLSILLLDLTLLRSSRRRLLHDGLPRCAWRSRPIGSHNAVDELESSLFDIFLKLLLTT